MRIRMTGLRKAFGPTVALDGVDLAVEAGEVHALIGENGAGKSTLMKVLSGVYRADAGEMQLDGQPYAPADPLDARRRGVVMIYQELALAPHLTVAANIMLGVEPAAGGWISRQRLEEQAARALDALGHPEINLRAPVSSLSVGARQLVELARALVLEAGVVVLDEPTSSLAAADVPRLFGVIARLRERGVSVIYISHFLEEVEQIAGRFTVLRDGRSVGGGRIGEVDRGWIIERMVGRRLAEMFPRLPHAIGEPVLELADLSTPGVESASLVLRRGEILGIAGLIGAGRTEMLRAVFGLAPVRSGTVRVVGVSGLLSEDRKGEGLAQSLTVGDNLTLSHLRPYVRHGWLDRAAQLRASQHWINRLAIRTRGPSEPVAALSGGNQQKVALARLLHHDCDVLLLDEPTRGIDVASKAQIYELIGQLAQSGKAILFVSSYLPELLGVCDTIAVMRRGRLGAKAPAGEWTEHSIMSAAVGAAS
ncbi:MAG: sugar ABC transporter ATP-binding protein [Acidobacteria bacterium]|nr:sugar ABC transporter ATP-binding protein [Acidobacteriota bacterium]